MKRITVFLLALAFCLSGAAGARAVELKVSGTWDCGGGWADIGFAKTFGLQNDRMSARQRIRTQINFIASEQLEGVLAFEIGTLRWGAAQTQNYQGSRPGGALDADGVNVETRRAYLNWMIPGTDVAVRMGIQNLTLPFGAGMGNPVMSDDVAGIMVSSPITDMVDITVFWIRPYDAGWNDTGGYRFYDETDVFGFTLPVAGEGWSVTPWGMLGSIGSKSGYYSMAYPYILPSTAFAADHERAMAWWLGAAVKIDLFDPLTFGFDAMYGRLNQSDFFYFSDTNWGSKGWFVDAALNYKLDWAVPGIFGWYASGDGAEVYEGGYMGRLPSLNTWDGDGFYPTSFGFPGSAGPGIGGQRAGDEQNGQFSHTGTGTWGVGVQMADMTFIDKLSHTLRVAYYQGTNNSDNARWFGGSFSYNGEWYLTTGDHVWEVNFDHKYEIYENLTAYLELGYLHLKLDKDTWGVTYGGEHSDNAWKAQLLFKYSF